MKIFDFSFADGKTCRVIDPDPDDDAAESLRSYRMMFKPGYLLSMTQIVAPPPARLPWKRDGEGWVLGSFKLSRRPDDPDGSPVWRLDWPGETLYADTKEAVSSAVRLNYEHAT